MNPYNAVLKEHYDAVWNCRQRVKALEPRGRISAINPDFETLEITPGARRSMWIYSTVGMAGRNGEASLEMHSFSDIQNLTWQDILESVAHYHLTETSLALGHTVNFGIDVAPGSKLTHGLISLPYLDGQKLEHFTHETHRISCLWLIPISQSELQYKKRFGLEALERIFEKAAFRYADPFRASLV